jgi:hypothetical protein
MGGMMGGGKGGGGGGKTDTGGGVSPEQQALAQYTYGENVIGDRAKFAREGMGPSTNETLSVAGSRFKEAEDLAKMSDADFKAMQAFNQREANSLQQVAGSAGQLIGGLGGGGGGGGGGSF